MSLHALANNMAAKGRNGDSMLVHMAPNEVAGLHALALAHGEKLTINPETGLPEAFKLKSLLPLVLGAALGPAGLGLSSMMSAGIVGAGYGLAKGSLKEGLMAGLGAYGGAGLAASLGSAGVSEAAAQEALKKSTVEDAIRMDLQERALYAPAADAATSTSTATTAAAPAGAVAPDALANAPVTPVATTTPVPGAPVAPIPGEEIARAMGTPPGYAPPTGLEALSKGAESIYDKGTFGDFAKANKKYLYSAGASALLSPENEEDMPETKRTPGYIRPARYDWRTGKYQYFDPVKSDEWGSRNLSEYTNANDPNARTPIGAKAGGLMALANGGAVAFADGGPSFTTGEGSGPDRTGPQEPLNSMGLALAGPKQEDVDAAWARQNAEMEARKARRAAFAESGLPGQLQFDDPTLGRVARNTVTGEIEKPYVYADGKFTNPNASSTTNTTGGGNVNFTTGGAGGPASSAASPYITPEAVNTTGDVGARNMAAGWNSYFDSSKAGDVWSFAGGNLTRNADGSTTFVGPDGKRTTFDRNTSYAEVARNAPSIAAKWAEDYGYTPSAGGGGTTPRPDPYVPTPVDQLNPDLPVPVTRPISEVTTGGSRKAYEYLSGQGDYPVNPYLPEGTDIATDYWKSVGIQNPYKGPKVADELKNPNATPKTAPPTGQKWVWNPTDRKWVTEAIVTPNTPVVEQAKNGGVMRMAQGGMPGYALGGLGSLGGYSDGGRLLRGPGDGVSDSIPATIGGKRPARLADGEFVVPARIVSELGNGSTEAGARKLYAMMDRVQKARGKTTGKGRVAKNSRADKYLPA